MSTLKKIFSAKTCFTLGAASLLTFSSFAQATTCTNPDGSPLYTTSTGVSLVGAAPTHSTRYPIVLLHGAFGSPSSVDGLKDLLTEMAEADNKVIELYAVRLPGMAGGEGLGISLAAEIEEIFQNDIIPRWECEGQVGPAPKKVHIIAHSLGTRSARAYISQYGGDVRVASATLVAGDDAPSPIVDLAVGLSQYENFNFAQGVWDVLDDFVSVGLDCVFYEDGFFQEGCGDQENGYDLSEGIIELSTNGYQGPGGFLERFPDVEDFPYTWHGGRIRTASIWNLGFWATWAGEHLFHTMGPVVAAGYGLYHTIGTVTGAEYENRESDGLVTLNMSGATRSACIDDQALSCYRLWEGAPDSVGVNHFALSASININNFGVESMYEGIIAGMLEVEY